MFWGGVQFNTQTELYGSRPALTAQRYVKDILEDYVFPFSQFVGLNFKLMRGNAQQHSAAIISVYLTEVDISSINWPPTSPDLNPIEQVWDSVKNRIRGRNNPPTTTAALTAAVTEEWEKTQQEVIQSSAA